MKPRTHLLFFGLFLIGTAPTLFSAAYVDLGGAASGYLAISNAKNSTTQEGIEGISNGLPEYPNYQMANDLWTAIIASPLDAGADYADFANFSTGFGGSSFTVNNQVTTQPDASTLSAGRIHFDNSLVSGSGTEVVGVGDLSFDFDTYRHDGSRGGPNGYISPFSPLFTPYNDGSGFGNAAFYYNISVSNLTGTGLTFQDGSLLSMDVLGDLSVQTTSGVNLDLSTAYTGTLTLSGLGYTFDVNQQQDIPFIFTDVNMIFNRSGIASVVPEPSASGLVFGLIGLAMAATRRRRAN